MATINFNQIGSFNGVDGGSKVLNNPTSIQFGPDGRLYVAEQNGSINAFTVALQDGEYIATDHEQLVLLNGSEVVKSIQNHNDDGSPGIDINNGNPITNRQVTGIVTTGTAANPVLYISSSDPRIAFSGEKQLDTNSGVVTRVTWTGTEWEAVDIIRGLPRSEENHAINGMVLSPDGTKLYLAVGGNTNNGAPSQFFSYTGEYALSGTVLEIDLTDIESRAILTDTAGGQNGTSRQYIYDLPTLDDPTVPNDGVLEDSNGLDVAGPWGGNDGLNMAILPADAPLRIYADGFRNNYDLVFSENGNLYTVDNGSNGNLGGNPLDANGIPTDQPGAGEATNTPNNPGTGNPEPLFLIEDGNYYGHPAPARSNQDLPWTVYDDDGNPDTSLFPNQVSDLSSLVPNGVNIQNGFIIDPSKFTGDATRLSQSGIRVPYNSSESPSLFNLGSSSNGLVEYTANAFDGALQGALIVTQFNGNVTLLNLSQDGTSLEPLIDPGNDGILGTADDETIDADGEFPLVTGQSQPLDVTVGPDGTIWVAEFGPDNINVFVPSDVIIPDDPDFDNDNILNVDDPFIRDATNGGSVQIVPGQTLLWDFDANQDDNLPGPNGYGGGLTGVMIDGSTDFEQFFQEPATLPDQIIKLDNVKFTTAAGGGTTVIESVSNGNPFASSNDGEYLFHTGVTNTALVDTFTVKWSVFNPANFLTGPSQQIGGYIGTGDQSNYLKIVAVQDPAGEIQVLLEDNDVVQSSSFIQADGLFQVPDNQKIFFELEIDPSAATATPTVTYELGDGTTSTVSGAVIDLSGTTVLDAILGDYTVQGQTSGLAVGLLASNTGQPEANTFQAIFDDIEITATGDSSSTVLYRVNAGGPEIAAIDGGIAWSADTAGNNSPFLVQAGSNNTSSFAAVDPGASVPNSTPGAIFNTERWDDASVPEMQWAFDVPNAGLYEVRLYLGNGFNGTNDPGERIFDVALEGQPVSNFPNLNNIDLSQQFGHQVGGLISNTVNVTDGTLNIEFLHDIVENPLINGIEILQFGDGTPLIPTVSIVDEPSTISEANSQIQISLMSNIEVPTGEAVDITFEIVPGTAEAQVDYEYLSATANFDNQTGVYTDTITIAENLSDASFLIDILPDNIVENDENFTVNIIGVSSNAQIGTDTASVTIEDDDNTGNPSSTVLYRVNAGGSQIAAIDGGLAWSADTKANNSPFLVEPGSNDTAVFAAVNPGTIVPNSTPGAIFDTERWDNSGVPEMGWAFDVPSAGLYEVRLYMGNGFGGTNDPGERVFDVAIEGSVPNNLNDVDLSSQFGHLVGGLISNTVNVSDGTLNIDFLHGVENPLINGIEIIQVDGGTPSTPTVSIIGGPYTVNEADSQVQISLLTDITVPTGAAVDVTFEIIPGSATPELDYEYLSGTFDAATGIYTDTVSIAENSSDATFLIDILQDTLTESDEAFTVNITGVSPNAEIGTDTATVTIEDDDSTTGEAVLNITVNSNNVQVSNFGNNSFQVTNTGDKKIAQIDIDVTNALYPDTVFDPFGQAGDTASRQLAINTNGGTGVVSPSNASYIGAGGTAGFEGIQLVFDESVDGGFETGESVGFAIDMDPNSVAGTEKAPLDAGSEPAWDVGGVSGAELIGSDFTVTFTDGTTATGQLQGVGNQGGSHALASQASPNLEVSLTVNGLGAGGVGTYNENAPSVIVNGPAGQTARIVLTKGFIQPVTPYAQFLEDQLNDLALADFPANNAVEFQTIDVLLTGENQDISGQFNLSGVANFNFDGEDQIPLGFVASIIDPTNNDLPLGSVTQPIYLEFEGQVPGQNEVSIVATQNAAEPDVDGLFTISLSEVANTDTVISYSVGGTAIADQDYDALSGTVTIVAGDLTALIDVPVLEDQEIEGIEDVSVTLDAISAGDSDVLLGAVDTASVTIADDDSTQNEVSIAATQNAAEPDVDGLFTVSLSEVANTDTVISYSVGGTAIAGQDYNILSGTVTIAVGNLSAPIDVAILDDQEAEGVEDVSVTLNTITAGDSNVLLGTVNTASVTIADDDLTGATVLYRVNAGGSQIAAIDGGLAWTADTVANNSPFLIDPGSNDTSGFAAVNPGSTVPNSTPGGIFDTERWDNSGAPEMQWAFDVPTSGSYEVRLYMGNGWGGTNDPGERVFDVALEGNVPSNLDNVDLSNQFGHLVGGVISNTVTVNDGTLNIEFLHDVQNPLINGIEILQLNA
ncbi:MAG: malectin domain-containing carbohydrate-binding protein [Cyanobacteria bacterium P01_G01_bin.67]